MSSFKLFLSFPFSYILILPFSIKVYLALRKFEKKCNEKKINRKSEMKEKELKKLKD